MTNCAQFQFWIFLSRPICCYRIASRVCAFQLNFNPPHRAKTRRYIWILLPFFGLMDETTFEWWRKTDFNEEFVDKLQIEPLCWEIDKRKYSNLKLGAFVGAYIFFVLTLAENRSSQLKRVSLIFWIEPFGIKFLHLSMWILSAWNGATFVFSVYWLGPGHIMGLSAMINYMQWYAGFFKHFLICNNLKQSFKMAKNQNKLYL